MKIKNRLLLLLTVLLLSNAYAIDIYQAAIDNSTRPQQDKQLDEMREPLVALKFSGLKPGMKAFDFFTGGGYYAELMANVVGEKGHVFAHNPPEFYKIIGSARGWIDSRQENNRLPNVSFIDEQSDALTLPSNSIDRVMAHLVLHDAYWIGGVPQKTLAEFYRILKPGGAIIVIDHAAVAGTGATNAMDQNGIHRIDEDFVIKSLEKVGFKLDAQSDAFRNKADDRTKPFFSKELTGKKTDRFMLRMVKPK
jgi:predicted methyltransferase